MNTCAVPVKKRKKLRKQFRQTQKKLQEENAWLLTDGEAKLLAEWDPFSYQSSEWFDPEWMFGVDDKFDIVIANPPYIDSELMVNLGLDGLRDYIRRMYLLAKGNWDIYIAFFELGFTFLSKNGILTFITPDKWIAKPFGDALRKAKIDNLFCILRSGREVFESSNVDSIISFFSNINCTELQILDSNSGGFVLQRIVGKNTIKSPYALDYLFSSYGGILLKIDSHKGKLSDHAICENACATSDAYNLAPLISESPGAFNKTKYLKIINTGTIGKYSSKWGKKEMTYLGNKYLSPVIDKHKFLEEFPNSYGQKSLQIKIILKGLNLLDACLDSDGRIVPGKSTLIISDNNLDNLKFLLSLINSKLAFFYFKERYPASSYNLGTTFTKEMINNFPIPVINKNQQKPFIKLTDSILAIADDTSYLANSSKRIALDEQQRQIEKLVFDLYGLTEEERKIVEGKI